MPSDAMRVWRDELAYAIKLADWAAGEGFCEIEGLQDPDEWCYQMWQELGPPNGDGYTADALAAAVIERAIAEAVEQERARIVEWMRTDAPVPAEIIADAIERGEHKERADG